MERILLLLDRLGAWFCRSPQPGGLGRAFHAAFLAADEVDVGHAGTSL